MVSFRRRGAAADRVGSCAAPDDPHDGGQIVGDVGESRLAAFPLLLGGPVARADEEGGGAAGVGAGLKIAQPVADHHRSREVYIEIARGVEKESGAGFAAGAAIRGTVGTDADVVDPGPLGALEGVTYYPERSIPLRYDTLAEELNNAVLTPKDTVEVKHLRDTVDMYWDVEITDQDKADIESLFAALPKNATNLEKIYAAYRYIQMNFSYARGWELYSQIWDKTPVDAVFNYHLAQCLQYNGAMAEVLAYMGYDVMIVESMRGMAFDENGVSWDYWNHYWMELYLNGETYLIEVGQPEDNWYGSFMVFYADSFNPYSTTRYLYYNADKEGYCALT